MFFEGRNAMALENKLGINSSSELANAEERLSKIKALELYESSFLNSLECGTFDSLRKIHKFLFGDIYDFAMWCGYDCLWKQ